jgi:hypothetical protein
MFSERGVTRVMRWFRSNGGISGAVALFALALQIVLAFGHIHLREFGGQPGAVVARATATDPASDRTPGQSSDDYCLICATAKLAGTLVLPSPVSVVRTAAFTDATYAHYSSAPFGRMNYALFHARAPPLA